MFFCTLRGDVGVAPYETGNAGSRHKAVERDAPTVAGGSVCEAAAESCPGTVLLTDSDNERPCPRERLSYKGRV